MYFLNIYQVLLMDKQLKWGIRVQHPQIRGNRQDIYRFMQRYGHSHKPAITIIKMGVLGFSIHRSGATDRTFLLKERSDGGGTISRLFGSMYVCMSVRNKRRRQYHRNAFLFKKSGKKSRIKLQLLT